MPRRGPPRPRTPRPRRTIPQMSQRGREYYQQKRQEYLDKQETKKKKKTPATGWRKRKRAAEEQARLRKQRATQRQQYTVKRGDTPESIAKRYGIRPAQAMKNVPGALRPGATIEFETPVERADLSRYNRMRREGAPVERADLSQYGRESRAAELAEYRQRQQSLFGDLYSGYRKGMQEREERPLFGDLYAGYRQQERREGEAALREERFGSPEDSRHLRGGRSAIERDAQKPYNIRHPLDLDDVGARARYGLRYTGWSIREAVLNRDLSMRVDFIDEYTWSLLGLEYQQAAQQLLGYVQREDGAWVAMDFGDEGYDVSDDFGDGDFAGGYGGGGRKKGGRRRKDDDYWDEGPDGPPWRPRNRTGKKKEEYIARQKYLTRRYTQGGSAGRREGMTGGRVGRDVRQMFAGGLSPAHWRI